MANIMETQQQQPESGTSVSTPGVLSIDGGTTGNLPKLAPAKAPESQWQRILKQIIDIFDQLPDFVGSFFANNQQAILTVVLILSAFVTVRVAIAILDAVNGVPLLAPIFEIIGIFYAIWFTFRYLIKAENRQELSHKVNSFKQQLLG
jgi:hypothetical protein